MLLNGSSAAGTNSAICCILCLFQLLLCAAPAPEQSSDSGTDLWHVHSFEHAESRLKASELADDRLGHDSTDGRPGGVSFEPRTDLHRKQHLKFARELAQRLDAGLAGGDCDRITLYASSPFLGELKGQLSPAAKKVLRAAADVDLTSYDLRELEERT